MLAWQKAFAETGLDPGFFTSRSRPIAEVLPWDHLDARVSKNFLREEREKSFREIPTADCRRASCNGCGVCFGPDGLSNRLAAEKESPVPGARAPEDKADASFPVRRFRIRFSKSEKTKYLGHLELTLLLLRAFRRAQIPLVFSQGFHPLPRVSFGPPLPVGYESRTEFLDMQIRGRFQPAGAREQINSLLPPGVHILDIQEISLKTPSAQHGQGRGRAGRMLAQICAVPGHSIRRHRVTLTLSVGLAQYKIHNEDWQSLLSRADAALYQAKNNGGNRWVIAED